jgi:RimJ/RimL family protein N-acetyltransferase
VKRYVDGGVAVDRLELAETLQWWLGYYDRGERYGFWAAIEKSSGRFIGWFHLRPAEGAGPLEPELGYRLRRDAWGRGYATEGSRSLIDKAFAEFGADRVYASTMAVNTASRRVMEKTGMRFIRTFHADWSVRIPATKQATASTPSIERSGNVTDPPADRHARAGRVLALDRGAGVVLSSSAWRLCGTAGAWRRWGSRSGRPGSTR